MSAPKFKPGQAGSDQSLNVKRVSPYPIAAQITRAEGQPPIRGQIVKLTERGFLVKVDATHFFKVGQGAQVLFDLPVVGHTINQKTMVVKTYDAIENAVGKDHVKSHIIEMHFKDLSAGDRTHIETYLVKSGQKKY